MNLTHDAMLVSLRINSWSGRLYDRQASQQVAVHHDADTNAGRYNKRLLPKQAFAALAATMSNARTSHYANTLPWDDQGGRLLTVANYDRYTAALDTLVERVVRERARFIEDYDDYVDQARLDLGRLFRLEDYPGTEALQGKFAIRYRIVPVPDARHFMADLAQGETERVKRDIEQQVRTRLNDAQRDLYRRLGEAVERVGERLREDENGKPLVFRDSLIENIRELVDVVPRLNIFADDDLAMLCREVKDKFAGIEPDALRPSGRFDPNLRRQVKRDADALTAQFAGYFAPAAGRAHPKQGSSLMAAHARSESARRVSDCVTALLRDQPFFGSLALRLPIRADETRETLASDGKDIPLRAPMGGGHRCRPDQDRAGARGPGLCVEASHPAGRPRPGALATGLAAGHPRPAARRRLRPATRGRSLGRHQRRAGLRPAPGTVRRWGGSGRRVDSSSDAKSSEMTVAALPAPNSAGDGGGDQKRPADPIKPMTAVRKSRTNRDRAAAARARNHPGKCPPATTLAAPARSWTRTSAATTPASPANRRWTRPPRSRRGTRPCTRPRASPGRKATRRAPSRRRSGKRTGASSTGGRCCAAT